MKYFKILPILLLIFSGKTALAQSTFDKWPAIKEFHGVMSQTFHPSEKGDLGPIKQRYKELATKAEAVNRGEIPDEFKTKEILMSTEQLQIKTKALQKKIILNATDAEITKMLVEIHDVFHTIVGLCSNEKH